MRLVDSPFELTTAATDALLGLEAVVLALWLRRGARDRARVAIWCWTLGLLATAALLGTVVHGLVLAAATRRWLWHPLFVCLGQAVGLLVVAAIHDRAGARAARRWLPGFVAAGLGFWVWTAVGDGGFTAFLVYEGAAILAALALYGSARGLAGRGAIVAGLVLCIVAAGVQLSGGSSRVLVPLDANGWFHLTQMAALGVLIAGVRRGES